MTKDRIGELALTYDKHPPIKALLSLVPGWSVANELIQARVAEIHWERNRELFDALATGERKLTKELIEAEDFLHAFFITYQAAINERRREKIRLFAQLLLSSIHGNALPDLDEYEKHLSILDDLEPQEIHILLLLDELTQKHGGHKKAFGGEDGHKHFHEFSKDFSTELDARFSIGASARSSVIMRLARTGCLQIVIPTTAGSSSPVPLLSPTYFRLKELINLGTI